MRKNRQYRYSSKGAYTNFEMYCLNDKYITFLERPIYRAHRQFIGQPCPFTLFRLFCYTTFSSKSVWQSKLQKNRKTYQNSVFRLSNNRRRKESAVVPQDHDSYAEPLYVPPRTSPCGFSPYAKAYPRKVLFRLTSR